MKADVDLLDMSLDNIMAYKGIYALCTTDKSGKQLKTTHWCGVLIGGAHPTWALWNVKGKFLRFYSFRSQIEADYPRLVWRRKMATWQCVSVQDKTPEFRRHELEDFFGKPVPKPEDQQS